MKEVPFVIAREEDYVQEEEDITTVAPTATLRSICVKFLAQMIIPHCHRPNSIEYVRQLRKYLSGTAYHLLEDVYDAAKNLQHW